MFSVSPSIDFGFNTVKKTLNTILNINDKKRERIDFILDPLQAIYTLALFAFYPVGSKISIQHNILYIQPPHYGQGAIRWLNSDSKEDIFHLFHACKRFPKFYYYLKKYNYEDTNLYNLIIHYAKRGLSKLAETYSAADKISLLYTIQLYQNILENPDIVQSANIYGGVMGAGTMFSPLQSGQSIDLLPENDNFKLDDNVDNNKKNEPTTPIEKKRNNKKNKKTKLSIDVHTNTTGDENHGTVKVQQQQQQQHKFPESITQETAETEMNLDTVFCNIHHLYNEHYLTIMLHVLHIIRENQNNKQVIDSTIEGFLKIYKPKQDEIKKWINSNLIF